jgi:hypothetical protein
MPRYQAKTLLVLYDTIGSVTVGLSSANQPKVAGLLIPVLMKMFQNTPNDRKRIALLECITSVVLSVGASCGTHLSPVVVAALQSASQQLQQFNARDKQETALLGTFLSYSILCVLIVLFCFCF